MLLLRSSICALALIVLALAALADAQVTLGTAEQYGVFAATTITNTGLTVVTGKIGLSPGTSITGFPPGIATNGQDINDGAATTAKTDIQTAYAQLAGMPVTTDLTGKDLGGLTLTSGVYGFSSSGFLTGTLILDAQNDPNALFVFKFGSTLITASASNVILVNGAQACNVYWQIGSSATFGTATVFVGSVLAQASITATTGVTVNGGLYAITAAVTLDTNIINTQDTCAGTVVSSTATTSTTSLPTTASTATSTSSTSPSTSITKSSTSLPKTTSTATSTSSTSPSTSTTKSSTSLPKTTSTATSTSPTSLSTSITKSSPTTTVLTTSTITNPASTTTVTVTHSDTVTVTSTISTSYSTRTSTRTSYSTKSYTTTCNTPVCTGTSSASSKAKSSSSSTVSPKSSKVGAQIKRGQFTSTKTKTLTTTCAGHTFTHTANSASVTSTKHTVYTATSTKWNTSTSTTTNTHTFTPSCTTATKARRDHQRMFE